MRALPGCHEHIMISQQKDVISAMHMHCRLQAADARRGDAAGNLVQCCCNVVTATHARGYTWLMLTGALIVHVAANGGFHRAQTTCSQC